MEAIFHIFTFESTARKLTAKFAACIYIVTSLPKTVSPQFFFLFHFSYLIYFSPPLPPGLVLECPSVAAVLSLFTDSERDRHSTFSSMLHFPSKYTYMMTKLPPISEKLLLLHIRRLHKFSGGSIYTQLVSS